MTIAQGGIRQIGNRNDMKTFSTYCNSRGKENPNSGREWPDELARVILDCGGKRSATPLSDRRALSECRKSGVALRLPPQSKTAHLQMLLVLCAAVLGLTRATAANTNDLATSLQKGLFEEEANHNYPAAIQAYQAVIDRFDDERKLGATAIFRLSEVYRKQGKTNEA